MGWDLNLNKTLPLICHLIQKTNFNRSEDICSNQIIKEVGPPPPPLSHHTITLLQTNQQQIRNIRGGHIVAVSTNPLRLTLLPSYVRHYKMYSSPAFLIQRSADSLIMANCISLWENKVPGKSERGMRKQQYLPSIAICTHRNASPRGDKGVKHCYGRRSPTAALQTYIQVCLPAVCLRMGKERKHILSKAHRFPPFLPRST